MSDQTLRLPGLDEDEQDILNKLVEQLRAHERRDKLRSALYDGKNVARQVSMSLPPSYQRMNMVLGWAAKTVDGLARRCNLDGFAWPDGDLASLGFNEVAEENFLLSELAQARTDSLLHGVSFLIATQGVEGEPRSLVHGRDALNATGLWNDRTRSLDAALSVTAREDNEITGLVLYLDGATISATREQGRWKADRSNHAWGVPVQPLVYRPRLSRRMGRSRITRPVIALQFAALRAMFRLEAHMDIYAIPKLVFLGASEGMFHNPDGTPKTEMQVMMGRLLGIPDDDDPATDPQLARTEMKQVDAQSPEPHLAQLNALAKLIARESDLPDSDFAITDMANPTSADAYSASRENLIAEAEGAMDDWSVPMKRTIRTALAIQNRTEGIPPAWASIEPKWRSPVYVSRAAQADAGMKQLTAAPWLSETSVGLELVGLTPQQIRQAQAEQRLAAGRDVIAALARRAQGTETAVTA